MIFTELVFILLEINQRVKPKGTFVIAHQGFMQNINIENIKNPIIKMRNFPINISIRKRFLLVDIVNFLSDKASVCFFIVSDVS